jgi:CRISPR/Cas system-associated protein endoribonuclease Cas2
MSIVQVRAAKIRKYLEAHPKSSRDDIQTALMITFRQFEDARDLLTGIVCSEKVQGERNFVFFIKPEMLEMM